PAQDVPGARLPEGDPGLSGPVPAGPVGRACGEAHREGEQDACCPWPPQLVARELADHEQQEVAPEDRVVEGEEGANGADHDVDDSRTEQDREQAVVPVVEQPLPDPIAGAEPGGRGTDGGGVGGHVTYWRRRLAMFTSSEMIREKVR